MEYSVYNIFAYSPAVYLADSAHCLFKFASCDVLTEGIKCLERAFCEFKRTAYGGMLPFSRQDCIFGIFAIGIERLYLCRDG